MAVKKLSETCLTEFLNDGLTQTQIAKACNISRQAVHARINYNRIPQQEKRIRRHYSIVFLRRIGFTIPEIMEYTGYCNGYVKKFIKQSGLTTKDIRYDDVYTKQQHIKRYNFEMEFLYHIGFDVATIAKFTKYSYYTVRQFLYSKKYSLKGRA